MGLAGIKRTKLYLAVGTPDQKVYKDTGGHGKCIGSVYETYLLWKIG